jgi:hypothetical protein
VLLCWSASILRVECPFYLNSYGHAAENSQETCRAVLRIATAGYRADVLNNDVWTRKAQDFCRTIRFDVSRSCASHVEKQLIAYYIDRHWLFDEDNCSSTSIELSQHTSLRDVLPSPPPAIITVNKLRMCSDCSAFYDQFCNYFMNANVQIMCVGR